MTTDQKSKKGSNLGCVLKIIGIIIGIKVFLFLLNTVKSWILADQNAQALDVFHNNYIVFQKYYLTIPFGSFGSRALIGFIISFIAAILIYGITYFLTRNIAQEKREKIRGNSTANIFWILVIFFILTAFFLPQQKVILNSEKQQIEISQYKSWYFFQSPFNPERHTIPFEDISGFKHEYYNDTFRGSTNYFIDLYCTTHSGDTIAIGHTLTHHGEFGFLDFKSQEERNVNAKNQAEAAIEALKSILE
ncbi:MAG: hypothetical protein DWQ02_00355 [Bacteroidetes bacterium]|nr:MAG: hypothetical protein DWQ02_00355 [Bacteroidota bacterium]